MENWEYDGQEEGGGKIVDHRGKTTIGYTGRPIAHRVLRKLRLTNRM